MNYTSVFINNYQSNSYHEIKVNLNENDNLIIFFNGKKYFLDVDYFRLYAQHSESTPKNDFEWFNFDKRCVKHENRIEWLNDKFQKVTFELDLNYNISTPEDNKFGIVYENEVYLAIERNEKPMINGFDIDEVKFDTFFKFE